MTKLKLFYFGHIMRSQGSLKKTIMLGKIEDSRKRGRQMRWIYSIKEALGLSLQKLSRVVEDIILWTALVHKVVRSHYRFNNG